MRSHPLADPTSPGARGSAKLPLPERERGLMTYANQLTVLRMAFVPVFVILVVYGYAKGALAVFVAAGLTDVLDGYIARTFGQNSRLGEILDPIADKVLLTSCFVVLTIQKDAFALVIPLWLTISVIGRDLLLLIGGLIINLTIGNRRFPPSVFGKATTFLQLLTVFTVLLSSVSDVLNPFFTVWVFAALALTVVSGIHYLIRGTRLIGAESSGGRPRK